MRTVWMMSLGLAAMAIGCADSSPLTTQTGPASAGPSTTDMTAVVDAALTSCSAPTIATAGFDDGSWGRFASNGYTLVADGAGRAAQRSWPAGRSSYGSVDATFTGTTRVYARWRYRQDATFDNNPSHQLLKFYRPGWNGGTGLLQVAGNRFRWYYDQLDSQNWYYQNVGTEIRPNDLRGGWHWFEAMNDITTSGALRVRLWIDGELKMDHQVARPNNGLTMGVVSFGGPMNAPSTTANDAFDDVALSSGCIVATEGTTSEPTPTPAPDPAPAPAVASVSVTPSTASLAVGGTTQLTAVTRDASGNALTGHAITWASSNSAVASVSTTGLVTARAAGNAVITATSDGQVGSASVSVASATVPVSQVVVSPSSATLTVGGTTQLSASTRDANGNTLSGRTVSWSSSDPNVATVSGSGLVTAVNAGSVTIRATSEGVSGSASVTVSAPAPSPSPTPAPPPPSTSCSAPNIMSSGLDGSYGPFVNDGYTLVQDATARGGWSATHTWSKTGSETYAGIDATFPGTRRVYARWRYKQDANFDNNSAIKKMLFTKGPNFGIGTGLLVISRDRFMWYYDRLGDGQTNYFSNVGTEIHPSELRGQWHWYELMNDITTSGALHVQLWIDGVLKMDHTLPFSNQGATIGTIMFNGTLNAPGTTGTDWLDDLAISSDCITYPQ